MKLLLGWVGSHCLSSPSGHVKAQKSSNSWHAAQCAISIAPAIAMQTANSVPSTPSVILFTCHPRLSRTKAQRQTAAQNRQSAPWQSLPRAGCATTAVGRGWAWACQATTATAARAAIIAIDNSRPCSALIPPSGSGLMMITAPPPWLLPQCTQRDAAAPGTACVHLHPTRPSRTGRR